MSGRICARRRSRSDSSLATISPPFTGDNPSIVSAETPGPAVDMNGLSSDKRGIVAEQKGHQRANVSLGITDALQGNIAYGGLVVLGANCFHSFTASDSANGQTVLTRM